MFDIVDVETQIADHESMAALHARMNGPLNQMNENLKTMKDHFERSKREGILFWISSQPYHQHHEQMKKGFVRGTGQWLLQDPVFQNWKDGRTSSILQLHGIPGSAKSKLASVVIEDAISLFKESESPSPAFFYCSRNPAEPERSYPEAILAGIVRQLSCFDVGYPLLKPLIQKYESRLQTPFPSLRLSIKESCELIIEVTESYLVVTIVIDALDECSRNKSLDFLEALETILSRATQLVKIFVSSRDDQDIVWSLKHYPNLRISSTRNMEDISTFVRTVVESLIRRAAANGQLEVATTF